MSVEKFGKIGLAGKMLFKSRAFPNLYITTKDLQPFYFQFLMSEIHFIKIVPLFETFHFEKEGLVTDTGN